MMVLKNNLLIFYQRNFIEFLTDLADQMNWLSAKNWYILKMEQFCAVVGKKIHQMICFHYFNYFRNMYQEPPDDGLKNGHAELIVKYPQKFKNILQERFDQRFKILWRSKTIYFLTIGLSYN